MPSENATAPSWAPRGKPTMAGYIRVKNFERFQHYRDRNPPWIKLYNELLDDYAFACLQDASKAHLVQIWLLASRYDNRIPHDAEWIARKINATTPVDLASLVSAGFIEIYGMEQVASTPLAPCSVSATPEGETEVEKEPPLTPPGGSEREKGKGKRKAKPAEEDPLFEEAWRAYPHRPNNSKAAARKAWNARRKEGASGEYLLERTRLYAAYCAHHRTEPRFVKQAATFYGPDRHYESDYEIPSGGVTAEDVLTLFLHGGAWLGSSETREHAFRRLEQTHPEEWRRAGPYFRRYRFSPLYAVKEDPGRLRREVESQLAALTSTNGRAYAS